MKESETCQVVLPIRQISYPMKQNEDCAKYNPGNDDGQTIREIRDRKKEMSL